MGDFMEEDIQSEMINAWAKKDKIEQTLMAGIHRITELKHNEKVYYLGEFKENVIRLLSKKQVAEGVIYPEVIEALNDKRATKMIIDGSINSRFVENIKK